MRVRSLHIYPVKSARGIAVKSLELDEQGPRGDREWMLVDEEGRFLSQRTLPKLAQVETVLDETHLTLAFGGGFFKISRGLSTPRPRKVQIWDHQIEAHEEPRLYSDALSQFLGLPCRLVRYLPKARPLSSLTEAFNPETRFTDRNPVQIANLQSLADLNLRLAEPVPMGRFRANIVFEGREAFEEDQWSRVKIGSVIFSQPKKCARCKIITLDEKTGENRGPEPLKTLSTYRREGSKVNFGVLWVHEGPGTVSIGDQVEIL